MIYILKQLSYIVLLLPVLAEKLSDILFLPRHERLEEGKENDDDDGGRRKKPLKVWERMMYVLFLLLLPYDQKPERLFKSWHHLHMRCYIE